MTRPRKILRTLLIIDLALFIAALIAVEQAFAEGADVAQIPHWDNDPVRNLPVELLDDLDGDRLVGLRR